ncbi:hypothetical protein M422DRAFT_785845 [Sphaerobolus stellatus SS14]|uniref:Ubiquitin-like protease family profile domain-containing protein n=1 Tax=Sphaerobolus stellatus (strain SS14) TaxID=990650 RepID=A0A0C9UH81_SPHS4|nr:hypothetical protein M422DRAFT_785845 [Sphaerobolus stellatus SS14]
MPASPTDDDVLILWSDSDDQVDTPSRIQQTALSTSIVSIRSSCTQDELLIHWSADSILSNTASTPHVPPSQIDLTSSNETVINTPPPKSVPIQGSLEVRLPSTLSLRPQTTPNPPQRIILLQEDLDRLKEQQWFNDKVMDWGMSQCLRRHQLSESALKRISIFSTYFYSTMRDDGLPAVDRWTRRWDVFEQDLLVIPIHQSYHWSIIVIYSPRLCISGLDTSSPRTRIISMDSLGGTQRAARDLLEKWLRHIAERRQLPGMRWRPPLSCFISVPQQSNFYDCGPFSCHNLSCFLMNYQTILSKELIQGFQEWNRVWKPTLAHLTRKILRDQVRLRQSDT